MSTLKPNQLLLGLCAAVVLVGALFEWTFLYWVAAFLFGWSMFEEIRQKRQANKHLLRNSEATEEELKERFKIDKRNAKKK
ncbi:hypothetical protein [Aerococcus vaginalis]